MSIISAENFLDNHRLGDIFSTEELREAALILSKELAEMHRQEALNQAASKARTQHVVTRGADYYIVNKDSILNAYSKKNIQ